jgi:type II secretory pathway component GspD/PulD (secretin)
MAWLLAGGVVAASAAAADAPAVKRQRSAVALKYGDAKALAETLGKHFKGDGDVSVLAEPATNTLLISAPEKAHADVVALVKTLDRRPTTIAIDVLIADLGPKKGDDARKLDRSAFRGPSAEVWKRVEELRKKGVITGTRRFRLTTLENEPVSLKTGGTKASVMGVAGGWGGRGGGAGAGVTSRSISYRDLGTSLDLTVRLAGDREAQVTLSLTDSRPTQGDGGVVLGKDENGGPIRAPEYANTTLKTRLAAPVGHAAPVQIAEEESGSGQAHSLVIVATRVIEPASRGD